MHDRLRFTWIQRRGKVKTDSKKGRKKTRIDNKNPMRMEAKRAKKCLMNETVGFSKYDKC